jgi:hypothetical protein
MSESVVRFSIFKSCSLVGAFRHKSRSKIDTRPQDDEQFVCLMQIVSKLVH